MDTLLEIESRVDCIGSSIDLP